MERSGTVPNQSGGIEDLNPPRRSCLKENAVPTVESPKVQDSSAQQVNTVTKPRRANSLARYQPPARGVETETAPVAPTTINEAQHQGSLATNGGPNSSGSLATRSGNQQDKSASTKGKSSSQELYQPPHRRVQLRSTSTMPKSVPEVHSDDSPASEHEATGSKTPARRNPSHQKKGASKSSGSKTQPLYMPPHRRVASATKVKKSSHGPKSRTSTQQSSSASVLAPMLEELLPHNHGPDLGVEMRFRSASDRRGESRPTRRAISTHRKTYYNEPPSPERSYNISRTFRDQVGDTFSAFEARTSYNPHQYPAPRNIKREGRGSRSTGPKHDDEDDEDIKPFIPKRRLSQYGARNSQGEPSDANQPEDIDDGVSQPRAPKRRLVRGPRPEEEESLFISDDEEDFTRPKARKRARKDL